MKLLLALLLCTASTARADSLAQARAAVTAASARGGDAVKALHDMEKVLREAGVARAPAPAGKLVLLSLSDAAGQDGKLHGRWAPPLEQAVEGDAVLVEAAPRGASETPQELWGLGRVAEHGKTL